MSSSSVKYLVIAIYSKDKQLTVVNELQARGIVAGWKYAVLTNHMSKETFGITNRNHKNIKGIKKQNIREHYTLLEQALISLSEAAAHEFTVQRDSKGFEPIKLDAIDGGKIGGRARADLESQGLKVVSEENYLKDSRPESKQRHIEGEP